MQRPKILYLITKGNWGGAQKYVYDLATAIERGQYDVVVACGAGEALPEKLATAGIRTLQLSALGRDVGFGDIAAFREIFSLLRRERPNILHLNSSKAAFLGALAAHCIVLLSFLTPRAYLRAPKIIFTVHGWPFNEPRGTVQRVGIYLLSWLTALLSNAIITICHTDERAAQRMIGVSGKTYCIHNGITPTALTPRHSAELSIVTIAELTKNKGLSYALGAIALLARDPNIPQFSYTLYGEGEERGTLERFIAERNLGHIVHLAGFVENAPARLAEADIFLLPSLKEGLPYAVLEAGAAGIAVVATAVGGMSDIIDDMKTGMLIRPKREREIADALRFLLTNHAKRTALAQALRDKIARYFSFEKMLSATQSVYGKFGKNLLIAAPCS